MLVSRALAAHGIVDTGSSGGGDTLLIMLGVAILFGVLYAVRKRMRRNREAGRTEDAPQSM